MRVSTLEFHRWTLGAKLASTFSFVIALVVTLVSLSVVSRSRLALEHEMRERGADAAQNLSRLGADLVLEQDLWGLYKVARDMVVGGRDAENLLVYAAVVDLDGRVLAHSDPSHYPMGEPLADDGAIAREKCRRGTTWSTGQATGELIHHFDAPVLIENRQVATARVGISLRHLEATIGRMNAEILALGLLLAFLGALLGHLISRRMTRPLRELGRAVDQIAAGQLEQSTAVSTKEKDEIGALADRFNLMARRLGESQRAAEEAQARVIRSERLASVGECAGFLAHEIRNPLGAVVAAARMLSSQAPQAVSYDREQLAAVIADEARRLNAILSDFLNFACPRTPSRHLHSINALVTEVLESMRLSELARGREMEAELGAEVENCEMDRDQIKQVLWNLIQNALEVTPEDGIVRVETALRGTAVAVEIADHGPGIPLERQARLFEPFYTTKKRGAGLGLAIAHRIVTAHSGTLTVSSQPGAGSRFCMTLPLRAARATGERMAAA